MISTAIVAAAPELSAQELGASHRSAPSGFRLIYGPTVAKPLLDDAAREPFVALGEDFRAGFGIRFGVGFEARGLEVIASAEYAGLDVGDPFERNGIPQGRRSSILLAYAATLWWSPSMLRIERWRPRIGGGYMSSALDNVSVAPSQLSGRLLEFARTVQAGEETEPTGISGSGFRMGIGVERDIGTTLAVQLHLEADRITYDEFVYDRERFDYDAGSSWVPRVAAVLRWAP